eukprot:jgi/Chlat1/4692/Chrsp3S05623
MSSEDEREGEEEQQELDLSIPDVVTKYKVAAEIANKALAAVIAECKAGAKVVDLCDKGDASVNQQLGSVFNKAVKGKKIDKGIAFPTCVSLNNCVCHFSPNVADETTVQTNDVVKIDLGVQIDGFIAVVAHTLVVQEDAAAPITGRIADAMAAAQLAHEIALRLARPGKKNADVTEALQKAAKAHNCSLVEGVLSHQMKQFVIDGNKTIISKSDADTKVDDFEFEENEVYGLDIVISTGEGKPKLLDEKQTTVYKRAVDRNYSLKMKASRFVFSEINQRFPINPFTIRWLDEKRGRLGLVECINHELLHPYPVLYEKQGEVVVHLKSTVLLMPNGSDKVTGQALQPFKTEIAVDDPELKAILALSTKTKKKGGGKKKKAKKAGEAAEAGEAETEERNGEGAEDKADAE